MKPPKHPTHPDMAMRPDPVHARRFAALTREPKSLGFYHRQWMCARRYGYHRAADVWSLLIYLTSVN